MFLMHTTTAPDRDSIDEITQEVLQVEGFLRKREIEFLTLMAAHATARQTFSSSMATLHSGRQ